MSLEVFQPFTITRSNVMPLSRYQNGFISTHQKYSDRQTPRSGGLSPYWPAAYFAC